uniref:Rhodanese domain-containing protein n=1 Tax=Angiostrongylus cantonensis TaxID=6313 RepID=A0A0K0DCI7_ANGCA
LYNKRKRDHPGTVLEYKRHRIGGVIEEDEVLLRCFNCLVTTYIAGFLMYWILTDLPMFYRLISERHSFSLFTLHLQNYHLETVTTNDSQAFRRIDANTLCRLMKSMSSHEFAEKYVLIDCRYPYEFNGGHIKVSGEAEIQRRVPIFYCEYSQKRGPSMAQMLRSIDRQRNVDVYPKVDFPEIYVVDKGYRNFFEMFADSTDKVTFHCEIYCLKDYLIGEMKEYESCDSIH